MEKLLVRSIDRTESNTILPYPAKGAEEMILYAKNPSFHHIAYYVNISGGLVVMGLDERRVLKDIECSISRSNWKENLLVREPTEYIFAALEFVKIIERSNELDLQVFAYTNQLQSIVVFYWGEALFNPPGIWLALSSQCFALISADRFRGFLVKLAEE